MKNLIEKRWLRAVALFALVLGVFFAVKALDKKVEVKEVQALKDWHLKIGGNPLVETDYELYANHSCPGLPEAICLIKAPSNGPEDDHPILDDDARLDIQSVIDNLPAAPPSTSIVKSLREE